MEVQGKPIDAQAEEGGDKLVRPERACRVRCRRMSIHAPSSTFRFLWVGDPLDYTVDLSPVRGEFLKRRAKTLGAGLIQRNIWGSELLE